MAPRNSLAATVAAALGGVALGCVPQTTPTVADATSTTSDPDASTSDAESSSGIPSGGSSSSSGPAVVCGDGVVDESEACDLGPDNAESGACLPDCTEAACGDGFVRDGTEECDDGNDDDTDACTNACTNPICGDGVTQADEECDDGDANGPNRACKSDCTAATCGDGVVHAGEEECDDANLDNNDGCNELCMFTDCGDGFWNPEIGEVCDDGLGSDGDECNDDCLTWGLWTDTYNGTASSNDQVFGVAFDPGGDMVVTGVTFDEDNADDVWVRKYDATGAEVWTRTFHSLTADTGRGVAVADDGDVFVVGSVFTASDNRDIWLRRYDSDGNAGFTRTHNGTADDADEAHDVAIDGAGNIIVVGYVDDGDERDIWVRKYNANGATQWTRSVGGVGGGEDEGHGVATDSNNNVIVIGTISTAANADNIWVRKYNAAGTTQWTQLHNGPGNADDVGQQVAVDSGDNVIAVGYERSAAAGDDVWVRKYDAAGTEVWTQTYNGDGDATDRGRDVAVDGADEIVVVGSTFVDGQSDNVWARRFDAAGTEIWSVAYNSPGFQSDVAHTVAIDTAGNTAVGGFVTRSEISESRNTWLRYVLP